MNEADRTIESATQQHLPGSPVASTGDAQVDAALTALQGLEEMPAPEQADVIEAVHDRLRSTLADLGGTAQTSIDTESGDTADTGNPASTQDFD